MSLPVWGWGLGPGEFVPGEGAEDELPAEGRDEGVRGVGAGGVVAVLRPHPPTYRMSGKELHGSQPRRPSCPSPSSAPTPRAGSEAWPPMSSRGGASSA